MLWSGLIRKKTMKGLSHIISYIGIASGGKVEVSLFRLYIVKYGNRVEQPRGVMASDCSCSTWEAEAALGHQPSKVKKDCMTACVKK